MDLKQFEYVLTVMEEKNFSRAAKKLFISQPSLSQYINRLETQLGFTIFDRSSNPLALTYEGELYVETALNILDQLDTLNRRIRESSQLNSGRLNLGLTPSKASNPLPAILPVFKQKYPGIELNITEATSFQLENMLLEGKIDICMINLPVQNKNIDYTPILTEELYLAAPPDFLSPYETTDAHSPYPLIDIKYLKDESFILMHPEQRIRQITDSTFLSAGIRPKVVMETGSIDTAHRLSASGAGFSFVPESMVRFSGLVRPPKYYRINEGFGWTLAIAYKQNSANTKIRSAFIETVKEVIKGDL
ncbi:MAG: LysR family transcriptional regulator [Firmicutes bacterium]|nr:LysR family transcriptional regulator [Bacillota bacterium]